MKGMLGIIKKLFHLGQIRKYIFREIKVKLFIRKIIPKLTPKDYISTLK